MATQDKLTCPYCGKTLKLNQWERLTPQPSYSMTCICGFETPQRQTEDECHNDVRFFPFRQLLRVIDDDAICVKLVTDDVETTIGVDAVRAFMSDRTLNGLVTDVWVDRESDGIGVALYMPNSEEGETDVAGLP